MDEICTLHTGRLPLLVSIPHHGTRLPDGFWQRLADGASSLPDTDWHVGRLYAFAEAFGASVLSSRYSRYVVDLNRPADDAPMYPGMNSTSVCPLTRFDGGAVYREGAAPGHGEIQTRIERYWRPYHNALGAELARLRTVHGRVVLWEAHSIRGELPWLFDGVLPDLNLGTAGGSSCSPALRKRLAGLLAGSDYTTAVDGRFKGGYITRHYGRPGEGVEAVQLEIAQRVYMDEVGTRYLEDRAARLQALLRRLLETCL